MKDRIKNLLIGGLKPSEIASVVGCSPAYVSQLLADASFKASVEAGMLAAGAEKDEEQHLDQRYTNTEHKLLSAIENKIPEASLGEVVKALDVINRRKDSRRVILPAAPSGININVVSLQLPAHALAYHQPVVSLNGNKEIIAIDAQPLAPMSSDGVKGLFEQMKAKRAPFVAEMIDNSIVEEL